MAIGTVTKLALVALVAGAAYAVFRRALKVSEERGYVTEQGVFVLRGSAKWITIFLTVMVALHTLGLPLSSVWTAISAVLVLIAVGFVAQWSILSNSLCAVFLVIYSPFRIGDEIELVEPTAVDPVKRGICGRVVDISLLFTAIVPTSPESNEDSNTRIRVPNNMFFQKAVLCRPGTNTKSLRQALRESGEEVG